MKKWKTLKTWPLLKKLACDGGGDGGGGEDSAQGSVVELGDQIAGAWWSVHNGPPGTAGGMGVEGHDEDRGLPGTPCWLPPLPWAPV